MLSYTLLSVEMSMHGTRCLKMLLPPTKEEVNAFARVRLSVCLSVSKITQKRVHRFG